MRRWVGWIIQSGRKTSSWHSQCNIGRQNGMCIQNNQSTILVLTLSCPLRLRCSFEGAIYKFQFSLFWPYTPVNGDICKHARTSAGTLNLYYIPRGCIVQEECANVPRLPYEENVSAIIEEIPFRALGNITISTSSTPDNASSSPTTLSFGGSTGASDDTSSAGGDALGDGDGSRDNQEESFPGTCLSRVQYHSPR